MKSLSFLPLYAVTVIGHVSNHEHDGVCAHNGLPLGHFSDGSEYSPIFQTQSPLATADNEVFGRHRPEGASGKNSTLHDARSGHNWTFSSPCMKSRQSTEEICVFTDTTFAQGRGISLVTTAARANFIASQPAFTNPELIKDINQDLVRTVPAKYKMREFPGKGMGLEATDHIKQGRLIMANTPSLMNDYRSFEWLKVEEYQDLQTAAVGYLPDVHQAAVMRLSTHDDATDMAKSEIVGKITSTNSFDIEPDMEDPEQYFQFYVLFPEISRFNHDCRPNAEYRFDYETMTQYVHALRDILPGEELTLSYTNPIAPRQERMDRLKSLWGFQCGCDSCTQDKWQSAASDDRVRQINSIISKLTNYKSSSRATPAMAELLISLYKQENLWGNIYEAYTYAALEYSFIGEPWAAVKYARMAIQYGLPAVGSKHENVVEMSMLADSPWQHWSWLLRTERRRNSGEHIDIADE